MKEEAVEITVEKEEGDEKGYDKYELESCVDTLLRAEEIKADAKKMAALKPHLMKKKKALEGITSLEGLKEVAKKKLNAG